MQALYPSESILFPLAGPPPSPQLHQRAEHYDKREFTMAQNRKRDLDEMLHDELPLLDDVDKHDDRVLGAKYASYMF
jgi:hypothetical protein